MKKRWLVGSLAVGVLLLVVGCSPLLRDLGEVPAAGRWYIKVNIKAPTAAKGITVSEYEVTGLEIQVRDPDGEVLQAITWKAEEGAKSYTIPVHQLGEHEVVVTHMGERDGQVVEATESATFTIGPMVITVVDIVPGCTGLIHVEGEGDGGATISGRVFDCVTGEGIPNATVTFGDYSATTGALGDYRIEVDATVGSVNGVFAAFKGLGYTFRVCGGMSLDPTTNLVYDISLCPSDTTEYTQRNLSGRIYDRTGAEVDDGSRVSFYVYNENGGSSGDVGTTVYDKSGGTGYSASCLTFGSSCLVVVGVDDPVGEPLFSFYLSGQDLSSDRTGYDLMEPATGYTSVTVNGTPGTMFQGYLLAPADGLVYGCGAEGALFGSSQATFEMYNPNDYPVMWWTMTGAPNTPGAGDMTVGLHAEQLAFTSPVSLPAPVSVAAPTETVDGATVSWDGSILSFNPAAGADGYMVFLSDDSDCFGLFWLNSSSIELPSQLVSAALEAGAGWDITVWPAAGQIFGPGNIVGLAVRSDISEGGVPYSEIEVAMVQPGVQPTAVDAIP